MDPNAYVYFQKKNKLEKKKIKKLKSGDVIVSVTRDWNVKMVKVSSIGERFYPSIALSKIKFKNGMELITTDYQRLYRLYDAPYNNEEPLNSGTYMTFRIYEGSMQVGTTEIVSNETPDGSYIVRVFSLNCEDNDKNLADGIIVNGVPVYSFN